MIMSPAVIVTKNRMLSSSKGHDKYSVDGLYHIKDCASHLEDCMQFLVADIASVNLIEDGFKVEYSSKENGNEVCYLKLDGLRFSSFSDNTSRQSEQRLLCAYLDYLSGF